MREQLKPCPFCGSPAEINVPGWVYADRPQFWRGVRCSQPPCPGAYIACGATEDSEEEAIAKITAEWNTRHADPAASVPPAAPSIQPEEKVFTGYSQGIPARAPSATSPARELWIYETHDGMLEARDHPGCVGSKLFREVQPVTRAAERIQESAVACANDKDKPWSEWDLILKLGYIRGILWGPGDETRTSRTINAIAYLDEILTGKFTYADDGHGPFVIPSTRQGFGLGSKHKFDSVSTGREAEEGDGVQLGEDISSPKSVPATRGEVSGAAMQWLASHATDEVSEGHFLEIERALVSKPERSQQIEGGTETKAGGGSGETSALEWKLTTELKYYFTMLDAGAGNRQLDSQLGRVRNLLSSVLSERDSILGPHSEPPATSGATQNPNQPGSPPKFGPQGSKTTPE